MREIVWKSLACPDRECCLPSRQINARTQGRPGRELEPFTYAPAAQVFPLRVKRYTAPDYARFYARLGNVWAMMCRRMTVDPGACAEKGRGIQCGFG